MLHYCGIEMIKHPIPWVHGSHSPNPMVTWPPQGFNLNIWDVGGQKSLRSYWRNYFETTDGLVWVVDSADRRRLADCKAELHQLLQEEVSLFPENGRYFMDNCNYSGNKLLFSEIITLPGIRALLFSEIIIFQAGWCIKYHVNVVVMLRLHLVFTF